MKIVYLLSLVAVGVAVSMLADYFLKKSGFYNFNLLAVGFILYGIAAFPVAAAFQFTQFGIVFLIWEAMTVTLALLMGMIIFKEPLTSLKAVALSLAILTITVSYFASKQI